MQLDNLYHHHTTTRDAVPVAKYFSKEWGIKSTTLSELSAMQSVNNPIEKFEG